jgi:hypothetical protein
MVPIPLLSSIRRFGERLPFFYPVGLGTLVGAFPWVVAAIVRFDKTPWDATPVFYVVYLSFAGLFAGLILGSRSWLALFGICAGQHAVLLGVLVISMQSTAGAATSSFGVPGVAGIGPAGVIGWISAGIIMHLLYAVISSLLGWALWNCSNC